MASNKKRGNKTELKHAKMFEKLLGEKIYTTRNISTISDNKKVDLENETLSMPYKVQCKGGINTPKYFNILKEMKANYPDHPSLIVFERKEKKNNRFYVDDDYVIMSFTDFQTLINKD